MPWSIKKVPPFLILSPFLILFPFLFPLTLFASGNQEAPEILHFTGNNSYSPNGDGVQDTIVLEFTLLITQKSEKGYLPHAILEITSQTTGKIIRTIETREPPDLSPWQTLIQRPQTFKLTRKIEWDGHDQEGKNIPCGTYTANIITFNEKGRQTTARISKIQIDNTPPQAKFPNIGTLLFSPNGDRIDDTVSLFPSGSIEPFWEIQLTDSNGKIILKNRVENSTPPPFVWDGKNFTGELHPDGFYQYQLTSTDLAGNTTTKTIPNIELNTSTAYLSLTLSDKVIFPYNPESRLTGKIQISNPTEVIAWHYEIRSADQEEPPASVQSNGPIPIEIPITGKDLHGKHLPEGFYSLYISATYRNGSRPATTKRFFIDSIEANAEIKIAPEMRLSPNQDGRLDRIKIQQTGTKEATWLYEILNSEEKVVFRQKHNKTPPKTFSWNGKTEKELPLPNGLYTYRLTAINPAGKNVFSQKIKGILIDNYETEVNLSLSRKTISPNNDGNADQIKASFTHTLEEKIVQIQYGIENSKKKNLFSVPITNFDKPIPKSFILDGKNFSTPHQPNLPDGDYFFTYQVNYENGNRHRLRSPFSIDKTPPEITFSTIPDPLGIEKNRYVSIKAKDKSQIARWELDIKDEDGQIIRSFAGLGNPSSLIAWNAKPIAGISGGKKNSYRLNFSVFDEVGNGTTLDEEVFFDLFLIEKNEQFYVMVPNIIFKAYDSAINSAGKEQFTINKNSLNKIKALFHIYPQYKLTLEGHALNLYTINDKEWEIEEAQLQLLTQQRTQAVFNFLVNELQMDPKKIKTLPKGGRDPLIPITDEKNRWKNRRVEFIMIPIKED